MTRRIHIQPVGYEHPYTRSDLPWRMDEDHSVGNELERGGQRFGWRLFHYLGGGGLRDFSLSDEAAARDRRARRLALVTGLCVLAWLFLLLA